MTAATVTCLTPQGREVRTDLASLLTPDLRETARTEANRWIKRLRMVPFDDGRSMRERFIYRGDSLWWFTELYLHKMKKLDRAVAVTLALDAARDLYNPTRIVVDTSDLVTRDAAHALGRARGVQVETRGRHIERRRHAWPSYLVGLTATLSRLRPSLPASRVTRATVAAFVHTAFWRTNGVDNGPRQESYIGPVLDAVAARLPNGDLCCVGVGPRRNFRARRWWDPVIGGASPHQITPIEKLAPRERLDPALDLWRRRTTLAQEITAGEAIRAAGQFRGCDLWQVLSRELEAVALLQWPWSARAMDEAGAAIDALSPEVVVTYAEAGGWGRALMLEARRRGVRSIGVQHGFIYRHWLNYLHEADEIQPRGDDRGCPLPDRTLLFDKQAESHLLSAGRFPPSSLAVTGSARLDELQARFRTSAGARESVRRELGVAGDRRLALLAAKFSEIRHELPELVRAVTALLDVQLVIKVHPAETPDAYASAVKGVTNISLAPPDADLARLLAAADLVVTMNSTVALDGLVLGLPALVIGLPNNLSPFVEAGVMLGADGADAIERALRLVLYDRLMRESLERAAEDYLRRFDIRADGRAAERAADEILGAL